MSIIEETRTALLELFPELAAAEVEARALAEPEAEPSAGDVVEAEIDAALAEMESMDLLAGEAPAEKPETPPAKEKPVSTAVETVEEEPREEGPRTNGIMRTDHAARGTALDVLCDPGQVSDAARILDAAGFFLESIAGVDWIKEKKYEVIYDYNQYGTEVCRVVVRTFIDRENPEIDSISEIFPCANWHERETHDFYGIKFRGHPELLPLLLPEDADFHPLRKDFTP